VQKSTHFFGQKTVHKKRENFFEENQFFAQYFLKKEAL